MWTLYHLWLSPQSRAIRIALAEKKLDFTMKVENVWERRKEFLKFNPAGEVPVLVHDKGLILASGSAILEYLEDTTPEPALFGATAEEGAEVRRLVSWFDGKFNREVSTPLINEKVMKRFLGLGTPNSQAIRAGKLNIDYHLDYIGYLVERRSWLAGEQISAADITAAAHLSCMDYLDDVPWEKHKAAKDWYVRFKSRPSFRSILADHIPGFAPPKHYANLDF